jgi:hypothetical protein
MRIMIKRCLVCGRSYHETSHTFCLCGESLVNWELPEGVKAICDGCGKEIPLHNLGPIVHWDTDLCKNEDMILCGNCAIIFFQLERPTNKLRGFIL